MASVRSTILMSNLRILFRYHHSRLSVATSKTCDFRPHLQRSGLSRINHGSQKLFSSQASSLKIGQSKYASQNFTLSSYPSKIPGPLGTRYIRNNSSRRCSQKTSSGKQEVVESENKDEATLTVFQRFKKTYKEHGKILIAVHCVTSTFWFGSFYMAAVSGVDLVPWMEQMGFSETIIKPFRSGGLGFVALAYLMYKLATPARYTVTLGGTNLAIRYLRRKGRMDHVPESHTIRNLYKDGKSELRDRQLVFQQKRRARKVRKERIARHKQ